MYEVVHFEIDEKLDSNEKLLKAKYLLARHCRRSERNHPRFAIKRLKSKDPRRDSFVKGYISLAREEDILCRFSNPNIVSVWGWSKGLDKPFFVTDRLYDTLDRRIKEWARNSKTHNCVGWNKPRIILDRKEKFLERLRVALDIASAMIYLHEKKIMHRDLRPENIGFDVRDHVKIFNFEKAVELHPHEMNCDGTFFLSSNIGRKRHVAPEVILGYPYNSAADVYSFGWLLYEICSMKIPCLDYSFAKHRRLVIQRGNRPRMNRAWSRALQYIIGKSWSGTWQERPKIAKIYGILNRQITSQYFDENENIQLSRRRSTFLQELKPSPVQKKKTRFAN